MNKINYAIYQFFVDKTGQERNLLVGFATGYTSEKAKQEFTDSEFRRDYLTATQCSEEDTKRPDLQDAIKKNIEELGIWAK